MTFRIHAIAWILYSIAQHGDVLRNTQSPPQQELVDNKSHAVVPTHYRIKHRTRAAQVMPGNLRRINLVALTGRQSDTLKMSEEELLWLAQTDDFSSACERLADFPARLKVITRRGALGAFPNSQQQSRFIQSQPALRRTVTP